ncbi:hypothetical protein, partial [Klebsiella pneumoniae]|uniref:hypothetical protein n=1 Tax=Klebsiella pneumoniae TaxID=573 RepID=UPI003A89DDE1
SIRKNTTFKWIITYPGLRVKTKRRTNVEKYRKITNKNQQTRARPSCKRPDKETLRINLDLYGNIRME